MAKQKVDTKQIMFNCPVNLVKELDAYANAMNVNRTSAMCFLISQALNAQKSMEDLGKLVELVQEEQMKSKA